MKKTNYTIDQQNAIDKQNSNILVSASAGSGKTAVLVERVVKKVIVENIDIDKLLVVTFTNASAVELKERLLNAIYKELDFDPNNLFLKEQLTNINRASITTIHAFCLEIIRSNFQILGLDPAFEICDEPTSLILKAKALDFVLESMYEKSSNAEELGLYKMLEMFSGNDEDLSRYILKIYSFIQSFAYPFVWLKDAINQYNIDESLDLCQTKFGNEILTNTLDEMKVLLKRTKKIREMLEEKEEFIKFAIMLDSDISFLQTCINCSDSWDKLYEIMDNIKFARVPVYKGENIKLKDTVVSFRNNILKDTIKTLKKNIYAKSNEILKDNKVAYMYLNYLYNFLLEFEKKYKEEKEKINVIDFSDIEHLSLNLLIQKDENGLDYLTSVAKSLQDKFVEVYTDEYQDTSFVQEAILQAVSNGHNRFMVGDIKQSIYRFRQAMPEIFNKKYDDFNIFLNQENCISDEKDCKIILAKNFRSRKNVLDSINYIFEQIMSKELGDCDYSNLETLKFGATYYKDNLHNDYTSEINILDLKKDDEIDEESQEAIYIDELKDFEIEAIYIAKKIKELVGNFMVYDSKKDEFHKAKYKDIVVIIRNIKDKGILLEKTLKQYEIPAYSDALSSLFEGDEIKLVLAFLRILDNPLQDIYLVSVMYSIIGDFTLDELSYIRNYDKTNNMYNVLYTTKNILEQKENISLSENRLLLKIIKFTTLLNRYFTFKKLYKVSDILTLLYSETNIYSQYALDEMSNLKKANLDILIEYAINIEKQMNFSLSGYITYIDSLIEKNDNSMSIAKILGENEDVVRIMTIHKSKGLEFPIVILSDTKRKYNTLDSTSPVTLQHLLGIGINVVNEQYNITYPSVIKHAIKNISLEETKSEELRMLYVALTRAKEKLIVFATVKDYTKLKDSLFVMYNNNKIDSTIVKKNNSYFENILMALNNYDENKKIFNIIIQNVNDDLKNEISINDTTSTVKADINKVLTNLKPDIKYQNALNEISEKLDFNYPFEKDTKTKTRITVSELKDTIIQTELKVQENDFKNFTNLKCLKNNNEYSSSKVGTLVHFILELLDFKSINTKGQLVKYIQKLKQDNILNNNDVKHIDIDKINLFLNSKIGIQLKNATQIFKEQEFILKSDNISNSTIEGIIDLYYINESGNVILVDFKTDKIKDENILISKYKKQLDIYKEAIETLTNLKVENVYIYSFNLNTEIEV